MQKYRNIKEKVKEIEFKLGVGYVKTDDKPYRVLRILQLLAALYLIGINAITLISFKINESVNNQKVSDGIFYLILAGTVIELAAVFLIGFRFHIAGNILAILPLPYFTFVFAGMLEDIEGFWGYSKLFYTRYFISYVIILLLCLGMLFIAIRQQIRTRKLYKRVLNNMYEEYKKKTGSDDFSVTDSEWDEFVKNYDPRTRRI